MFIFSTLFTLETKGESETKLLEKTENEQKKIASQDAKRVIKERWISAISATLAVVIILVAVFIMPIFSEEDYVEPVATRITQEEAYQLYKEIYDIRDKHSGHVEYSHDHSNPFLERAPAKYDTPDTQSDGVERQNFVKTDGQYIYTCNDSRCITVNITKVNKGKLTNVASINLNDYPNFTRYESPGLQGIYLYKDTLAVLIDATDFETDDRPQYSYTIVKLFDVSNPYLPVYITEYAQRGMSFENSHLIGNILYVFSYGSPNTGYGNYKNGEFIYKVDWHLPGVSVGSGDFVTIEDLYVFDSEIELSYFSGISINLDSRKLIDSVGVIGGSTSKYTDKDSIYLTSGIVSYSNQKNPHCTKTSIMKFELDKGKFNSTAKVTIDGIAPAINEHNGYLCAITSIEKPKIATCCKAIEDTEFESNSIYFLDKNLKIVSSITELYKDVGIFTVLFNGDFGYLETYENIDGNKFFALDFSNVKIPKILPSVKLPDGVGYCYPWKTDRMLSLNEASYNGTSIIKLAMLDTKDMTNVKLLHEERVLEEGTDLETHIISEKKNVIGFANGSKYMVYSFDKEHGFVKNKGDFSIAIDKESIQDDAYFARKTCGILIGDYLYVCNYTGIYSYLLNQNSGKAIDEIKLKSLER